MTSAIAIDSPYLAYSYSYPHKTAYRPLKSETTLEQIWSSESRDSLFLYMHIPFCEMRCGFCNLFTVANPSETIEELYVSALAREAEVVAKTMGAANVTRMAIGGGTPTFLAVRELHSIFDAAEVNFDFDAKRIPVSVETSPQTATLEKLNALNERGVDRISIGVQSFLESEVTAVGRSQSSKTVDTALDAIRKFDFSTLNIDLIYGLPGQTTKTLVQSIDYALRYQPEEIYLYPLYIRELTGLARKSTAVEDTRLPLYRAGRDYLLAQGYVQTSMRMFQLPAKRDLSLPVYCCQSDGMVGLGSGARSYTQRLHYSGRYAVNRETIRDIISDYSSKTNEDFRRVNYGYELDEQDRKRRFVIQSILQVEGMSLHNYSTRFGGDVFQDLPEISRMVAEELLKKTDDLLRVTAAGLEMSDNIGVRLYSGRVVQEMQSYQVI